MEGKTLIGQVWLLMLREGGRWSATELADSLGLKRPNVLMTMHAMALRGYAVRHGEAGSYSYGVTGSCKVPNGVTLEDIRAAQEVPA